ncbi:hypothetical protein JW756_05695 [Candidatus Woesearchaeota archaeon]|nr:hypothetical protein [Candidatus Woesearchaeota archaeon]
MNELGLLRKKKNESEKDSKKDSELFEEPELDLDSDHPVHEEFVDSRKLRKTRK